MTLTGNIIVPMTSFTTASVASPLRSELLMLVYLG
jgi:hypothetical protein